MLTKVMLAMVCCALAGAAKAAPLHVCPTLATGKWVVATVSPDENITALSDEEAHAYIGKKFSVSDGEVNFAGARCRVIKQSVHYSTGDYFDVPGFPYTIRYDCAEKSLFVFDVGSSCDHIATTGWDGWTFRLRRDK